jgi:uncharacterized protein YndB with AHSA1/START domain
MKNGPPAAHGTFTIARELPHAPERVFAAWSDPKAKAAWFSGPSGQWKPLAREMDFRVGGRERAQGRWTSGVVTDFQAYYLDIVPVRRMKVTEQGAFLDGYEDNGSREHGTNALMDALAKSLEK